MRSSFSQPTEKKNLNTPRKREKVKRNEAGAKRMEKKVVCLFVRVWQCSSSVLRFNGEVDRYESESTVEDQKSVRLFWASDGAPSTTLNGRYQFVYIRLVNAKKKYIISIQESQRPNESRQLLLSPLFVLNVPIS